MNTITKADLQATVDRINRITGSPMEPYTKTGEVPNQTYSANVGNYHLSGAYGGYALHRMDTDGGGVTDVLRMGHISKRALYDSMFAFIKGMDAVTEKGNI
jgi:hypothetical protein